MNPESAIDYSAEYAAEDEAIERVAAEMEANDVPADEVKDVVEKLRHSGTAVVEGDHYRIHRDPVKIFDIDWKDAQRAA